MISNKLEAEVDYDNLYTSEASSVTTESSSGYESQDSSNNKGGAELRTKVKKLRSIKLGRLPSLKLLTRQLKFQPDYSSVYDAASSQQSTPLKMLDPSPNYMKTTTSADAKKENLQKQAKTLMKRSSFKPARSLTRLSSTKFRRPMARRSSGGTDLKKKLKKARSIKLVNRCSIVLSGSQASLNNSVLGLSSNGENRSSSNLNMSLVSSGNNSMSEITRTTLRPVRMLTKVASLRTRRPYVKKFSQVPDSIINKATCSSALKDSKFPDHLEVQPGESESEGISAMKVCPYSYCSLHGHQHSNLPPLKRFVSMRRRQLKTQKNMKMESRTSRRVRRSVSIKKGMQTNAMTSYENPSFLKEGHGRGEISSSSRMAGPQYELYGGGIHGGDKKENRNSAVHLEFIDFTLQNLRDSGLRDKLPSNGAVILVAGAHLQDSISSSNFDMWKGQSESNTSEASTSTVVADEPFGESKSLVSDKFVESRAINSMVSFASVDEQPEEQTQAEEENNESTTEDCQFITSGSGADSATDVTYNIPTEKQRHMGLWRLIYHHMASGIAAEDETQQPHDEGEKEEQGKDKNILTGMKKSDSCLDFAGTDKSLGLEDLERSSSEVQFYQFDAIRLVREAFDKILSEIPDQSSDAQSINSDTTSDREHQENNVGEGIEFRASSSLKSGKDSMVKDSEGMRLADNTNASKEKKAAAKVENIANKQTPKSWSNLKKIIILKRFVKALEKVKNLNLRKPRYSPIKPDPEAEKVHLRHQTMEGRKNSEEWMLDYALQQVISTLAPAQKRKVALLVQAFETVTPLPEVGAQSRSNIVVSSHATPVPCCTGSPDQKGSENGKQSIFGVFLRKTPRPESTIKENEEHSSDLQTTEVHRQVFCSELKESSYECDRTALESLACKNSARVTKEEVAALHQEIDDNNPFFKDGQPELFDKFSVEVAESKICDHSSPMAVNIHTKEFLANGEVLQDVHREERSISASEGHDIDSEFSKQKLEPKNLIDATRGQSDEATSQILANNNQVSSFPGSESQEEPSEAKGRETKLENNIPQGSATHEKKRNMRLWYMIYKHMVSGSTALLEEAVEDEQADDISAPINNAAAHQGSTLKDHDTNSENHNANDQKVKLQQIEAIRLVEEAIDEIPLPENQGESPDNQSVTSDIIPDHEHREENPGQGEAFFISTSTNRTKEEQSTTLDPQEPWLNFDHIKEEEKSKKVTEAGNESNPPIRKSWSNLKKLILLKRFIKSLEKVKKFSQHEPRFLPPELDKEAEKVQLRHQDMEDRKQADEWMLDYALQQVVAKLTPARKRKVALLVEAFETVIPTIES